MSREKPHPDPYELQALLDGELPDQTRCRVGGHLDRCGRCREQVSGLRELFRELDLIERTQGAEPGPDLPHRVMAEIMGD